MPAAWLLTVSGQGEWFNAYAGSLAGNTDYDARLEVRALANGTLTVNFPWLTVQGSPTANGGGTTTNASQQVIGSSWVKLAEASFTNSNTENADLALQSHIQFISGNPGDQILIGMGVDNVSSNGHNSVIYVPGTFPDGVNGFDNIPNAGNNFTISPGSHVFQLWAKNNSGGSTTVQYAQIQGIGFPISNGAVDATDPVRFADVSGPIARGFRRKRAG